MGRFPVPDTVFLDRDGVLNVKAPEGDYVTSPTEFRWLDGAVDALRALQARGCRLLVVTNQRGVATGKMSLDDLEAVHHRMRTDLEREGVLLDGIYACTHQAGTCECRKPGIGLFVAAMRERPEIDPAASAVVGDALGDVEAANRIGAAAFLIVDDGARPAMLHLAADRALRVDAAFPSLGALVTDGFGLA